MSDVIQSHQKVIDIIKSKVSANEQFFSFEFYPPKTKKTVDELKQNLIRMMKWGPQFCDVTWGAGGTTSELTPELCDYLHNDGKVRGNAMMHLTCTNMEQSKVDIALEFAKKKGIRNIVALRGDPPKGQKEWKSVQGGFTCARDLVRHIRQHYGDYFGIAVAGYPEGHPLVRKVIDSGSMNESEIRAKYWAPSQNDTGEWVGVSREDWMKEMNYLKSKVDAGADLIITQLFYDAQLFIDFVGEARKFGIAVPIIPGIMPIKNFDLFTRMTGFCKTVVPPSLRQRLEQLKNDNDALVEYGMQYMTEICEKIIAAKVSPSIHIYTMNLMKPTIDLIQRLGGLGSDLQFLRKELAAVVKEEEQQQSQKKTKKKKKAKVSNATGNALVLFKIDEMIMELNQYV